jgi:hypothetical protein
MFYGFVDTDDRLKSLLEYLLQRAAIARARTERQIVEAVEAARVDGISWAKIGTLSGTSAQAAQQRYGAVSETI